MVLNRLLSAALSPNTSLSQRSWLGGFWSGDQNAASMKYVPAASSRKMATTAIGTAKNSPSA